MQLANFHYGLSFDFTSRFLEVVSSTTVKFLPYQHSDSYDSIQFIQVVTMCLFAFSFWGIAIDNYGNSIVDYSIISM